MGTTELSDLQQYLKMAQDWAVFFAPKVIFAFLVLWVGLRVIKKINDITDKTLTGRNVEPTIKPFFASLVDIVLKLVLFLIVANIFGFETTSFVAVLSAMAFAVGLALQGSLGHFASGILLLLLKPYKVGDEVKIGDVEGFVTEIQVFNTILKARDNKIIVIPNGNVTSANIINLTAQPIRRMDITIVVDEHNDVVKIKKVLEKVLFDCKLVLKNDENQISKVFLNDYNPDELRFMVHAWCNAPDCIDVHAYIMENSKIELDEAGLDDSIQFVKIVQ